jgi:hypothetical protein
MFCHKCPVLLSHTAFQLVSLQTSCQSPEICLAPEACFGCDYSSETSSLLFKIFTVSKDKSFLPYSSISDHSLSSSINIIININHTENGKSWKPKVRSAGQEICRLQWNPKITNESATDPVPTLYLLIYLLILSLYGRLHLPRDLY